MNPETTSLLLHSLDLFGTVIFAISGGLAAARKRMDLFGFVILSMMPAIGGGSVRDVLLGNPAFWIARPEYILIAAATALVTFVAAPYIAALKRALLWADAVGLAAFTIIGTQIALAAGAQPIIAIFMGIVTTVVGGMLRDILCGEIPLVLQREVYAAAALVGAFMYWLLQDWGLGDTAVIISFFIALGIRLLAIQFGLSLPTFREKNISE